MPCSAVALGSVEHPQSYGSYAQGGLPDWVSEVINVSLYLITATTIVTTNEVNDIRYIVNFTDPTKGTPHLSIHCAKSCRSAGKRRAGGRKRGAARTLRSSRADWKVKASNNLRKIILSHALSH